MKTITSNATLIDYTGKVADKNVTIEINDAGDYVMHGRVYPAVDFANYGEPIMTHKAGGWSIRYKRAAR